jgi:hypothetical protein
MKPAHSHSVIIPCDDSTIFPLDRFPNLHCLSVFFLGWRQPDALEKRIRACTSMRILVAARQKRLLRAYFQPEYFMPEMTFHASQCAIFLLSQTRFSRIFAQNCDEPLSDRYFDGYTYQHT